MRWAVLLMRRRNDLRPISTNRKPPATMPQRRVLKTEVTSLEVFSCLGLGRLADSAACDDGALRAALRVLAALGRREDRPLLLGLHTDGLVLRDPVHGERAPADLFTPELKSSMG